MIETVFHEDGVITVTNLRLKVKKRMVRMSTVKAAEVHQQEMTFDYAWLYVPLIFLSILTFKLSAILSGLVLSLCLLLAIYKVTLKNRFHVMVRVKKSPKQVYTTKDKAYALEVVSAINEAIADRKAQGLNVPDPLDDAIDKPAWDSAY